MTNKVDANNSLMSRAYCLWENAGTDVPLAVTQQKIVSQLFLEVKKKNPWMGWFYSFVEFLFPKWMELKVKMALSAYKYDLVISGEYKSRIKLFSGKERWYIDQKLLGVFKNIIEKKASLSLSGRAYRWENKIKKYYNKRELMIGSYILFQIGRKFPNFKNSINWIKAVNLRYLEKHCVKTFKNLDDDAITKGLIEYLEKPFDGKKGVFQIFAEISYYVTKEKVKITASRLCQIGVEKVTCAGKTALSGLKCALEFGISAMIY